MCTPYDSQWINGKSTTGVSKKSAEGQQSQLVKRDCFRRDDGDGILPVQAAIDLLMRRIPLIQVLHRGEYALNGTSLMPFSSPIYPGMIVVSVHSFLPSRQEVFSLPFYPLLSGIRDEIQIFRSVRLSSCELFTLHARDNTRHREKKPLPMPHIWVAEFESG
jgi:hypothetical protein